jgi:hypothetical protein
MVLRVEAHSTAVIAEIFKLSAAAQTHTLFAFVESGRAETITVPCPAALTLLGPSSPGPVMVT